MAERIHLDPTEVAIGRQQFDITPWISVEGVDWGDGAITAYMAEAQRGEVPADFRIPNRTITMPLNIRTTGGTTFATARGSIQAKAALFQQEGGWIKRVVSSGGTVYADIVNASLKLSGDWMQAQKDHDLEATLVMEAIPDFYGNEIDLGDNTGNINLSFTDTGIQGNYPARCRIVVDNDAAFPQLGLIWGVRSRHYNASAAAALMYPVAELTAIETVAGTDWTPFYSTDRDSGTAPLGALLHTGTYRVWAKWSTASNIDVDVRFVWDVGDLTLPEENALVRLPRNQDTVVDMGEVRLDPAPVGTHRWKGVFQVKGVVGGENPAINRIWIVPVDEGYGVLRAPLSGNIGLAAYSGRSSFTTETGAITGDSADVGGAWVGAGDTDDFTVAAGVATRTAVSDTAPGRIVTLNTNMTNTVVQVDAKTAGLPASQIINAGVIARYVDVNNYLGATLSWSTTSIALSVFKVVASVITNLYVGPSLSPTTHSPETFQSIRLMVTATGQWVFWVFSQGSTAGIPIAYGTDTVLATAGALATGDVGFRDQATLSPAVTRTYDNFAAWVPPLDAVAFASQSVQLGTDGMFREDSTGSVYGPVTHVLGDLPRLPPAGPEGRTTEVFIKMSRGDLGQLTDNGSDDLSARPFYRPSWLTLPS